MYTVVQTAYSLFLALLGFHDLTTPHEEKVVRGVKIKDSVHIHGTKCTILPQTTGLEGKTPWKPVELRLMAKQVAKFRMQVNLIDHNSNKS
ncbi:MAG: hypothetical protein ACYDAJ_04080 [Nitrosotalea sp.]